jgi:hypothetical protein
MPNLLPGYNIVFSMILQNTFGNPNCSTIGQLIT